MKRKLFTILTLLLCVCSGAWGQDDVPLKSIDFTNTTNFPAVTYYSSTADVKNTVNGVLFWAKKGKNIKVNNTTAGVDFDSQNVGSNGQHGIAIPVTGVNDKLVVKVIHSYNNTSANFKVGIAHANNNDPNESQTFDLSLTNSGTKNKNDFQVTKTDLTGTDYIVWVGESSSSYKVLEKVEIYTTSASGRQKPSLSVSPTSVTLAKEGTQQLTATRSGDGAISFSSSNTEVATVNASGLVTAVGNGSATITVTSEETDDYDEGAATMNVIVKEADPTIRQYAQFDNALTCNPEGFVTIGGSINYNSNYPGTYDGKSYSKGLKMQSDTEINFTTTSASCDLVIVQSTNTNVNNFKIDGVAFATDYNTKYYYDIPANKIRVHVYKGLTAGNHTIVRAASAELGILYVGVTEAPAPSLSVSPSTASAFSYEIGNGPSTAQTFTVTGSNMTSDDITVSLQTGDTNYEISSDGTTYSTSNLTVATGDAVYVRLKAGLALGGSYTGTLRFANDGADNVDITLSGSVNNQTYAVTYVLNGGEGDAPTESAQEAGASITLAAAPTRTCYTFAGWLCSADAQVKTAGFDYTMTAANTTFTAQWTPVYSSSLDFAAQVTAKIENDTALPAIATFLESGNIVGSDLGSSAWETGSDWGGTIKGGFLGYKLKANGAKVTFLAKQGKLVTIVLGSIAANVTLTKNGATSTISASSGDNAQTVVTPFVADEDMLISLTTTSSGTVTLKKILISDYVTTSISSVGYATYATSQPLDFTYVSGVEAYTATADGATVTFNKVSGKVPANTGLLLYKNGGTASDVYVSVEPAYEDAISNVLVANVAGGKIDQTTEGKTNFVLKADGEGGAAFYKVSSVGFTMKANTAYLSVAAPATSRFNIVFDGDSEATDIRSINGEESTINGYYDLQGRHVSIPTKGLYIVNGKKVVIK